MRVGVQCVRVCVCIWCQVCARVCALQGNPKKSTFEGQNPTQPANELLTIWTKLNPVLKTMSPRPLWQIV